FSMFTDIGDQLSTQKQLTEDSKELALLRQEEGGYGPLRSNLKKYLSLDDATLDVISGVVNGRDAADTVMQVISPEYKKQRMETESAARAARMAELQERLEGN